MSKETKTVDFSKVELTSIDGSTQHGDMSKIIGNAIYFGATDIDDLRVAQDIYDKKKVDVDRLSDAVVHLIYTQAHPQLLAFAKIGLDKLMKSIGKSNNADEAQTVEQE